MRLVKSSRLNNWLAVGTGCLPLFLQAPVNAGGVRDIVMPPCAPLVQEVVVDGSLAEWDSVEKVAYVPLNVVGYADFQAGRDDVAVSVRSGYDAKALYLSLDWSSPAAPSNRCDPATARDWAKGGDGVELHLRVDGRVMHIVSFPSTDGSRASLLLRQGTKTEWSNLLDAGGAAAVAVRKGGWTQELRIPWASLRPEGMPAVGKPMELAFDLAWGALGDFDAAAVEQCLRRTAMHTSHNVLTARHRLHSNGYLPDSNDWGVLRLADKPARSALRHSPQGVGFCELTASRAATPLAIDGELPAAEWPAELFAGAGKAPEFLGRRYGCDLATRFDDANLYLAARIASPVAPFNSSHEREQNGYSGGDCLQVRLDFAGKKINLCAWAESTTGKPALTADGKDLPQPFLLQAGAKLAIRHDPVAGSYVMEMALPWQALFAGMPAPKTGDALRATTQAWWIGQGRMFSVLGALSLKERGALSLRWNNPADGHVTLGLYDQAGALQRWITRSDWRLAGDNTEFWDGLDQWGKPLSPGDYEIKAINHPPLTLENRVSLGNAGDPPWPSTDGKGDWLSDECPPQAAVTDGDWVFMAAPGSEKGWAIMALDGEGRRQWGSPIELYPRCVSLALEGERLYAVFSGPEPSDNKRFDGTNANDVATVVCLDKRTGKAAGFSTKGFLFKAATSPYRQKMTRMSALRKHMAFTPAVYAGQPRYYASDVGDTANYVGAAVSGGRLYVSCFLDNKIMVLDAESGTAVEEIPLPAPVGLTPTAKGLLAVSGATVVRIDPATKAVTPVITAGLEAPHSLCVDGTGDIYVSDWGKSFQVKVFSPDGTPLRAIGKAGGRPWVGAFDKNGMLLPRGVAVTTSGKLWVTEDDCCPRRISVWNAKSGSFERDFIGPISYGGATPFWVDPADDQVIYSQGAQFQVDYKTKTWTPKATVMRQLDQADPFTVNGSYSHCDGSRTIRRDGREYVMLACNGRMTVLLRQGDRYVTVAAMGCHAGKGTDAKGTAVAYGDSVLGYRMYPDYLPAFFASRIGQNFAWSDRNGDGLPQEDEMTWAAALRGGDAPVEGRQPEWETFWGATFGPDMSVYFAGKCRGNSSVWRVDLEGFTDSGAPRYDMAKAVCVYSSPVNPDGHAPAICGLHVNDDNQLFVTYGFEWWPSGINPKDPNVLECRSRDGKLQWAVAMPKDFRRTTYHATNVIDSFTLPGVGGVIGTWNWHGNFRAYLLTDDGLYIDTMLEDTKLGPYANWDESYRRFFKSPDGTPNIVNSGSTTHHILAIGGLDKATRFGQKLTISPEESRQAAAMRDMPSATTAVKPVIAVTWAATPPTIDGSVEDWIDAKPTLLKADDARAAEVMLARDRDTLYLAWQVLDPSPMVNLGDNWRQLFITGDCVDLMIAADPKADPKRREPVAGDQRLLFSVFQNKPIAVLFKAVVPGAKEPTRFVSVTMDEVLQLDQARISISRAGASYTLEAAVPLACLGVDPATTESLRGDVGVVFSDQTGRNRELRLYHYNKDTAMTADLPTETRLQPGNWGDVLFPLGLNLLRDGGFEGALSGPDAAWKADVEANGAAVRLTEDGAHSGRQALLLEQTEPLPFTPEALKNNDFNAFCGSVKGGHVSIGQSIPVTGGKRYACRLFLRSEGIGDRMQAGDPKRGFASATPFLFWRIPGKPVVNQTVTGLRYQDLVEWKPFRDDSSGHMTTKPLVAPEGAESLGVCFKATFVTAGRLPKFWVDDIELVEVSK